MQVKDIIEQHRELYTQFKSTGDLPDELYDALFDFYLNSGSMPYGIAKARTGDPVNWIIRRLEADFNAPVA